MRQAIIFNKTSLILEEDGTIIVDGAYWIRNEKVFLEAIEFFTLALKNYKEVEEKRKQLEQTVKAANTFKNVRNNG